MPEFGHFAQRGAGIYMDTWGVGPFILNGRKGKRDAKGK